jgi:signal transduction histidine kinase
MIEFQPFYDEMAAILFVTPRPLLLFYEQRYGMDAMRAVTDRSRELLIRSQPEETAAIRVAVQDTGTGIDLQDMNRIFTAFFTTKPEGLGMGLAISRSIIEAHGGRLWATPNTGPGTTFQFTLPIHGADQV